MDRECQLDHHLCLVHAVQILDGVAVDNSAAMKAVPRGQAAVVAASAEEGGATGADADSDASESTAIDDELRARLENLRKPGEAP